MGKQTVDQAQRNTLGGPLYSEDHNSSRSNDYLPSENFSLTDGNASISPQLLKQLQSEGFSMNKNKNKKILQF